MSSNSAQAVKDKLRNISNEKNINFNAVLKFYMYDRFIERLSKSKYRDNIVLKVDFIWVVCLELKIEVQSILMPP